MGRPRAFDEIEVTRAAVTLFATRSYDGISIDDLVAHLGVHRNSLYKVFGSKRGLYLAALRWYLEHRLRPSLATARAAADPEQALRATVDGLDLLLLAAVDRAPEDPEVSIEVGAALREIDEVGRPGLSATLLGLRVRARAGL